MVVCCRPMLQKKILDNNNIPNETIDITANVDFAKGKKKYYLSQVTNYKFIKSKFGKR